MAEEVFRFHDPHTDEVLAEFTREDLLTEDELEHYERFEELVHREYESLQAFVDKVPKMNEHLKQTPTDTVIRQRATKLIENDKDEWKGGGQI